MQLLSSHRYPPYAHPYAVTLYHIDIHHIVHPYAVTLYHIDILLIAHPYAVTLIT